MYNMCGQICLSWTIRIHVRLPTPLKNTHQDTLPKEATSLFLSSDSPLVRELFTPMASSPASPARKSNGALKSPPPPGGGDAFLTSPGGTSVLAAASVGGQFKQQVGNK